MKPEAAAFGQGAKTHRPRRIVREKFFPILRETTERMMEAYGSSNYTFRCLTQHEWTQLAVCRKACNWNMDEMMSEYNAATADDQEDDTVDSDDAE